MAFNKSDLIYKTAYDSVMNAQKTKNKGAIDNARAAVGALNGTDAGFAVGEFSKQLDGVTPNDYKSLATAEIDPQVAGQKTILANTLAEKLAASNNQKLALKNAYDSSNIATNTNFDNQVGNQNRTTKNNMNGFSNSVLGRGLGRSTVATSGLGEMQNINTRMVGDINTNRANSLQTLLDKYNTGVSGVEGDIANANSNYANQISDIDLQKLNNITTLARTLEDRDFNKYVTQTGLDADNSKVLYNAGQDEINNQLNREKYATDINEWNAENALKEAQITGMYKGQPTLEKQALVGKLASGGSSGSSSSGSNGGSSYKVGSKGTDVKQIQSLLGIPADGVYGNQTKQSVMEFQRSHGLTADGVVGAATLSLLDKTVGDRRLILEDAAKSAKDAGDNESYSQLLELAAQNQSKLEGQRWNAMQASGYNSITNTPRNASQGFDDNTDNSSMLKTMLKRLTNPIGKIGSYIGR